MLIQNYGHKLRSFPCKNNISSSFHLIMKYMSLLKWRHVSIISDTHGKYFYSIKLSLLCCFLLRKPYWDSLRDLLLLRLWFFHLLRIPKLVGFLFFIQSLITTLSKLQNDKSKLLIFKGKFSQPHLKIAILFHIILIENLISHHIVYNYNSYSFSIFNH